MKIAINTPNGNIGRSLANHLLDAGQELVLLTRSPEKTKPLADRGATVSVPRNLEEALEALRADHDYLLEGGVFHEELIDSWIEEKTKEVLAVRNRPHPFEMNLYYNL